MASASPAPLTYPDLRPLYRLPCGVADNPNVVIEPTGYCNMHCQACYRGSNDPARPQTVMTLAEMRQYIDEAMRLRKFHTLSFLGGEPLLHPQLDDAILYGVQKGLAVGLYTNGHILHKHRARELLYLGVNYVFVHVDRHQGRGDTEREARDLRAHFCEMFRALPGLNFGIGIVVHESDLDTFADTARFFQENSDVIRFVNISTLGPNCLPVGPLDAVFAESHRVDAFQKRVCAVVQDAFGFEFSSYLGSKYRPETPGKILATAAYRDGRLLGSMSPAELAELHGESAKTQGRYPYVLSAEHRRLCETNRRFGDGVQWQTVAISMAPLPWEEGVMNICDNCTDCVLYEHHFVPMCQLGPFTAGNPIVVPSVRYW